MKPNQNHLAGLDPGLLKSKFHEKTKSYEVLKFVPIDDQLGNG